MSPLPDYSGTQKKDWVKVKFGDCLIAHKQGKKHKKGKKPKHLSQKYSEGVLPYATAEYFRTCKAVDFVPVDCLDSCVHIKKDELIIIWDGSNAGEVFIGREDSVLASTMALLEVNKTLLDTKFCYFFLKAAFKTLNGYATGSTTPHVSSNILTNLEIPLPPLPEQQRIVAFLDEAFHNTTHLTEKITHSLRETQKLKNVFLHQAFTPANTAGWVKVKLGDICSYDLGKTPERDNPAYWKKEEGSVPWVKIADMSEHSVITETSENISELAFHEKFRGRIVPAGTLLMSFKLTIGRVAYLGIPACHNEAIISIYPKEGVDKYYLGYFLSQVNYSGIFDRAVKGNTLNKGKIDRIPILLPPIHEQQEIVDFLTTLDQKLDIHRRKRACLENIFRLFLPNLTRGTLRFTEFPEGCF